MNLRNQEYVASLCKFKIDSIWIHIEESFSELWLAAAQGGTAPTAPLVVHAVQWILYPYQFYLVGYAGGFACALTVVDIDYGHDDDDDEVVGVVKGYLLYGVLPLIAPMHFALCSYSGVSNC